MQNSLNLNKNYTLIFIEKKFYNKDKNQSLFMSFCDRVNEKCENKRYTICDSNFLINFLNFCTNLKKQLDFKDFFKIFSHLLKMVCECCEGDKFFCSKSVYDKEFNETIYKKVKFLLKLENQTAKRYLIENKNKIKAEYKKYLNYNSVDKKRLDELKVIADQYTIKKKKGKLKNQISHYFY